jgi:uncharacterized cupredoxin-like copper-binding protein
MSRSRLAALIALSLLATACSTAGSSTPTASTSAATGSSASPGPIRVAVKLSDNLKMEPAAIRVPVGQAVTFVVTNTGATEHEFIVGDEAVQMEHEGDMASMDGMSQDEPNGIGVKPGETKELTMTFAAAGTTIAACHEMGHYAAGMQATITIGG